jgi:hypothetical protein
MARKLEWLNPNKAKIETGHKTFDRQCEAVMQGQLIGTCQYSMCIRPVNEVECNGHRFDKGALRAYDLKPFHPLPFPTHRCLDTITYPVILYKFRHWGKKIDYDRHQEIVDGYIITTYKGGKHKLLHRFAWRAAGERILDWVLPYLVDEEKR